MTTETSLDVAFDRLGLAAVADEGQIEVRGGKIVPSPSGSGKRRRTDEMVIYEHNPQDGMYPPKTHRVTIRFSKYLTQFGSVARFLNEDVEKRKYAHKEVKGPKSYACEKCSAMCKQRKCAKVCMRLFLEE